MRAYKFLLSIAVVLCIAQSGECSKRESIISEEFAQTNSEAPPEIARVEAGIDHLIKKQKHQTQSVVNSIDAERAAIERKMARDDSGVEAPITSLVGDTVGMSTKAGFGRTYDSDMEKIKQGKPVKDILPPSKDTPKPSAKEQAAAQKANMPKKKAKQAAKKLAKTASKTAKTVEQQKAKVKQAAEKVVQAKKKYTNKVAQKLKEKVKQAAKKVVHAKTKHAKKVAEHKEKQAAKKVAQHAKKTEADAKQQKKTGDITTRVFPQQYRAATTKFPKKDKTRPPDVSDFKWYHGLGIFMAALGLILAAGGGIGGGGLLVPIYIICMRFSEKWGIPLSNVTILGGALANNYFNMWKRHPNPDVNRPMIDYDLVLLMEPPTIAGAVIGSILNKVLPEYVITSLLVVVLGLTAVKTYYTGVKARAKEIKKESGEGAPLMGDETKAELDGHTASAIASAHAATNLYFGGSAPGVPEKYEKLIASESVGCPAWKVAAITFCFLLVVACNLLKLQLATCGSPVYWVLMVAPIVITLSMSALIRVYLLDKGVTRRSVGAPKIDGDCDWTPVTTITYPAICTLAGLFAGMFGIGGGIVKGPLMLEMGVLPEVSAATAAFMILYTASAATVTYATFGQVKWDWAGILFCVGLVFTSVGQTLVNSYIARTGRASIIVFIIAAIVGLSTLLMGYQSIVISIKDINAGDTGFGDVCA